MMILGNAGIVTMIITTTTSFVSTDIEILPLSIAVLLVGVILLYFLATRTGLAGKWEEFVERRLGATTLFEEGSVDELLHLIEGYGLVKLILESGSPLVGQSIGDTGIPESGFRILGIERDHDWIAAPRARQVLLAGDRLVIYGQLDALRRLAQEN